MVRHDNPRAIRLPPGLSRANSSPEDVYEVKLSVHDHGTTAPVGPNPSRYNLFSTAPSDAHARAKIAEMDSCASKSSMSPRKCDPRAALEKARRLGAPLKVRLCDEAMAMLAPILAAVDSTVPLKKKPGFAEEVGPELADAMKCLDPMLPVKKSTLMNTSMPALQS